MGARSKGRNVPQHRAPQPVFMQPMLATLTTQREFPGARGEWVFEHKLDGIRALAFRSGAHARLVSRNRNELGSKYPEIIEALEAQPLDDFIVDGEVVAFAGRRVSFQQLQQRLKSVTLAEARRTKVRVAYYAFDLLWLNGFDTRSLPLMQRKRLLEQALAWNERIRYLRHKTAVGTQAIDEACRRGWEGVIAKKADAPYIGARSRDWYKVKCGNRQEFVIGGYTDPKGSRVLLGALLVGYYQAGELRYAGKVGSGFSDQTLRMLQQCLSRLKTSSPPFGQDSALPRRDVHWVKPELVGEFEFSEWTQDGKLRHPRFLGLRSDKSATQVVREQPVRNGNS